MKPHDKQLLNRIILIGAGIVLVSFCLWRALQAHDIHSRLQAIRAAGYPATLAELDAYYPAVPAAENAAMALAPAFAALRNDPDAHSNEFIELIRSSRYSSLAPEKKQLVDRCLEINSHTLAVMAKAIRLPHARYPVDFSLGPETLLPHLDSLRDLAAICRARAEQAIASGRPAEADEWTIDIFGLARTLEAEPILISYLVRDGIIRTGVRTLETRLNAGELTAGEFAGLQTELTNCDLPQGLARALAGERALTAPFIEDPSAFNHTASPVWAIVRTTGFLDRDLQYYLQAMSTNIALAGLPPPQNLGMIPIAEKMAENARKGWYYMSSMILPGVTWITLHEAESDANLRLAQTAIALEQFRLAEGRLPEHLAELAPQFLPAVPADPFDGQPLRYHRLDTGYVVYSVGRDKQDDGGRERPAHAKSSDHTTYDLTFTVKR